MTKWMASSLLFLAASCSASPHDAASLSDVSGDVSSPNTEHSDHEEITLLARDLGITGAHGSNYTYVEEMKDGTHVIVRETSSSRSKYKTITPTWKNSSGMFIDCSYIQSIEDQSSISTGSYCRGATPASSEAIEEAVSDQYTSTFSGDYPWLTATDAPDCSNRLGIEYGGYRIVRCNRDENNETTEGVTTYILSDSLSLLAEFSGFEFSGASKDRQSLVIWSLWKDSPHELIEWSPRTPLIIRASNDVRMMPCRTLAYAPQDAAYRSATCNSQRTRASTP